MKLIEKNSRWFTIVINYTVHVKYPNTKFSYNGNMRIHRDNQTCNNLTKAEEHCIQEVRYRYRDAESVEVIITSTSTEEENVTRYVRNEED